VPAVYWLSGLTCTDDNFRVKAGAQRYAAELGLALVIPDTSPRGAEVPDVPERYDLGQGAGFYVNATQAPWARHYRMYDYVTRELPALVEANLPLTDCAFHHRPFDGRSRRIDLRVERTGPLSFGFRLRANLPPDGLRLGARLFQAYLGDDREDLGRLTMPPA
jgi:S-formylglutathione hydrolase